MSLCDLEGEVKSTVKGRGYAGTQCFKEFGEEPTKAGSVIRVRASRTRRPSDSVVRWSGQMIG